MRLLRVIVVLLLLITAQAADAQTPSVSRVVPSAIPPGYTVDVVLHGSGLEGPTALWTSIPATTECVESAGDRATYRVTLPPEAQVGIAGLRVATRRGVSNLHLFMVDDLPTVAETAGNTNPGSAQLLAPPIAVDGACDSLGFDYYRLTAKRGQRLSVDVVATRVGSAADPVVRLLDISGRELKWADDTPGAAGDCRFTYTFALDGEYRIELRDVAYEGGPTYRYRLRVGDFPLPAVPFPLGGRRGSAALFSFLGDECDDAPAALVSLPAGPTRFGIGTRRAGGAGSGFVGVIVSELDETVEAEPNDSHDSATPLALPAAVSGRFESPGDIDFYKLAARKGERFSFRAATRGAGSPCDVIMQWGRMGHDRIASSKIEASDGTFDVTAPEDGTYWLRVEEISAAGGPALAYRIEAERFRPGFSLSVDADKVDAKPGDEIELKVTCARREYSGEIALSLDGVTPAKLDGAIIPAGKQEAQVKIKLPPDLPAGAIVHFKVVGTATINGESFRTAASTAPALRRMFPRLLYPPAELDGFIALGVRGG